MAANNVQWAWPPAQRVVTEVADAVGEIEQGFRHALPQVLSKTKHALRSTRGLSPRPHLQGLDDVA